MAGTLIILSAPSGAGKTSLVQALCERHSNLRRSISCTTRQKRPGEVEGEDYYFLSEEDFEAQCVSNHFLEHATVFDSRYGTLREHTESLLSSDQDVILDIDWQGAAQIFKHNFHTLSVFILPPSLDTLAQRLADRAQDQQAVIDARMMQAQAEIAQYPAYDYLVVNEHFEDALNACSSIIQANHLRTAYQSTRHATLLHQLLSKASS